MNTKDQAASANVMAEDPYEPLKRYTKEDLKKYLETLSREAPGIAVASDQFEPLKRFTKDDLRRYLATQPKAEAQEPLPGAAQPGSAKPTLAPLLEADRQASKLEQPFPRSFATKPCKPNVDPDPKARVVTVALIIALFVGTAAYLVIQRQIDKSKPHETPKNMPMHMRGGLHSAPP